MVVQRTCKTFGKKKDILGVLICLILIFGISPYRSIPPNTSYFTAR